MSAQQLILDLNDLAVESIEVVPSGSVDKAIYDHGVGECDCEVAGIAECDCDNYTGRYSS